MALTKPVVSSDSVTKVNSQLTSGQCCTLENDFVGNLFVQAGSTCLHINGYCQGLPQGSNQGGEKSCWKLLTGTCITSCSGCTYMVGCLL